MPSLRSQAFNYLIVFAAALLLYSPVLIFGMPYGHDGATYAGWLLAFEHDLAEGELYPRWLSTMGAGAGSPAFFFYPPLVYYLIAAIDFAAGLPSGVFHRIGIGVFPFFALSGGTLYWAVRPWLGRAGALCGALVYLILPYHYGVDLWFRGDFAEFAGYAWAPLCFGFLWRLDRRSGLIGLPASFALLVVTHLPSAVIVAVGLGVAALWRSWELKSALFLFRFAGAVTVGIMLAGIYLVPALTLQDFTSMHRMWLGGLRFSENFVLTGDDPNLKLIQIGLAGATVGVLLAVARPGPEGFSRRVIVLLGAVAAVWMMMLPVSYPIWKMLPFLQKVQFPWRLGMLLDIGLAVLAGVAAAELSRRPERLPRILAGVGLVVLAAANLPLVYAGHFFLEGLADPVTVRVMEEALARRRDPGEYLPPWASEPASAGPKVTVLSGSAEVHVEAWRSRNIRLGVVADEPSEFLVHQYYIPLWRASLRTGEPLAVGPATESGLVKLSVPSGSHRIALQLARAPAERWGLASTLFGLAAWGLLLATPSARGLRRQPRFGDQADRELAISGAAPARNA